MIREFLSQKQKDLYKKSLSLEVGSASGLGDQPEGCGGVS